MICYYFAKLVNFHEVCNKKTVRSDLRGHGLTMILGSFYF